MADVNALFSRLDFTYPGLAEAARHHAAGDGQGALAAVIEHFRTRRSPTYLFDESDIARFSDRQVIAEAEQVLAHHIWGYDLGPEIDWRRNATEDSSRDPEWTWSLSRQLYWLPLARAYALTGDERYAREWVAQLQGWAKAWPVAAHMADDDPDMRFPGNHWRSIEAGIRIYCVWLPLLPYLRRSPSWDEESWVTFLNLIHDHAEFLMTHYSNHKRCSNWLTMEATALFQLGVMFPEFKRAHEWQPLGYRRVMHEVRYQFDHYGVHMERTPVYHLVAANAFLQAYRIAKLNGLPVPPYMLPILEKSAEYLMRLVKPDFSLPMIGDADRDSLIDRKADTSLYEGMNNSTDPLDLNELRAFFRIMAEETGREDFRWLATGRAEGKPPAEKCYAMPDPGFYVCRSGWGSDDSYMLLTGTALERGENNAHSHFDAGHLELHVQGEDVLIDAGRYIYGNSAWQQWRRYFRSTCAHNTVLVDGHEMGAVPDTSAQVRGVRTWCHRFQCSPELDLVEVSHNGYAFMDEPVFHLRRLLHLKPGLWLVDDVLTGVGKHEFELYFNFPPDRLQADGGQAGAYIYTGKRVRVSLVPLLTEGLAASLLQGSEAPIGGWVSYGYAIKVPAPQLIYSKSGEVPTRFLTAILQEGTGASVQIESEGVSEVKLVAECGGRRWEVVLGQE